MRRLQAHHLEFAQQPRMLPRRDDVPAIDIAEPVSPSPDEAAAFKQAYLEGFEAGYADGDKEARRHWEEAESAARAATESARAERETWREQVAALTVAFADARARLEAGMEALAIEIAFAATCHLLGQAHVEQRLLPALCRAVLENARPGPLQVRVAESDLCLLSELGEEVDVVADPALRTGDCIVSTPRGDRDGSIETRLCALQTALLDTLRRGSDA